MNTSLNTSQTRSKSKLRAKIYKNGSEKEYANVCVSLEISVSPDSKIVLESQNDSSSKQLKPKQEIKQSVT